MEMKIPFKRREVLETKIDRLISELPDYITEEILCHLSTKDVVRTSILSRKWRHKWTTIPTLVFGEKGLHPAQFKSIDELASTINHVLLHHDDPIHKFQIYYNFIEMVIPGYKKCDNFHRDMDRWILHLPSDHIKELSLVFDNLILRYTLPSCIFSWHNLTRLELHRCALTPPATFKGFGNLKFLRLLNVILTQDMLEILLCHSPLLESAYLWIADCFDERETPKFQFFEFIGKFIDPLPLEILWARADQSCRPREISSMSKFFYHLLHFQSLTLKGSFLEYLALCDSPKEFLLHNLEQLSMSVNFNHQKEILAALCLLSRAPNLQELNIVEEAGSVDENVELGVLESDDGMNCLYAKLRRVRMSCIVGSEGEIYFMNLMLSASPVLETMTIDLIFPSSKTMVVRSLCSKRAKIIFKEPGGQSEF